MRTGPDDELDDAPEAPLDLDSDDVWPFVPSVMVTSERPFADYAQITATIFSDDGRRVIGTVPAMVVGNSTPVLCDCGCGSVHWQTPVAANIGIA